MNFLLQYNGAYTLIADKIVEDCIEIISDAKCNVFCLIPIGLIY